MIVYIASYPRSGNFWLQNLLGNQFKRITTDIHDEINNPNALEHWTMANKRHYNIDIYPLNKSESTKYGSLFKWMVGYKAPEEEQLHKGILPGCLRQSNPSPLRFFNPGHWRLLKTMRMRDIFSKDPDYYFLKTHLYPHSKYFDGEYVIQIVRNPGACLWSYYNFKRDLLKKYHENLSSLIQGDRDFGSWSQYHDKWARATRKLGPRYLLVQYENLFGKQLEFCERLEDLLDLHIESVELRLFDFYHKLMPTLIREGKAGGWEKHYSKDQLKLLWNTHGDMMTRFGYQEPNYDFGMDEALY